MRWWVSAKLRPARLTSISSSPSRRHRSRQLDQLEQLRPAELPPAGSRAWRRRLEEAARDHRRYPVPSSRAPLTRARHSRLRPKEPSSPWPSPSSARSRSTPSPRPSAPARRCSAAPRSTSRSPPRFFTEVRVVGPVGDDFGDAEYAILRTRGTNTDDVEHVAGRQNVLLESALRLRHQHRAHRRHPAGRLRRVRAEAVAGERGQRGAVPRQHPAGRAARGARAVEREIRRARLDEPVDRDRPRLARSRRSRRSTASSSTTPRSAS